MFPLLEQVSNKNCSHLASTYCALAILKMVGYNLSNINPEAILKSMRKLQQHDGRYICNVIFLSYGELAQYVM